MDILHHSFDPEDDSFSNRALHTSQVFDASEKISNLIHRWFQKCSGPYALKTAFGVWFVVFFWVLTKYRIPLPSPVWRYETLSRHSWARTSFSSVEVGIFEGLCVTKQAYHCWNSVELPNDLKHMSSAEKDIQRQARLQQQQQTGAAVRGGTGICTQSPGRALQELQRYWCREGSESILLHSLVLLTIPRSSQSWNHLLCECSGGMG